MLYVDDPIREITITATGRIITEDRAGVIEGLPNDLPPEVFLRPTPLTNPEAGLIALADEARQTTGGTLAVLHALNSAVRQKMTFEAGTTEAQTPAAIAYEARHGVCQDFAHVFIATARVCGIPARYVSGHLFRRDVSGPQEAGHAWAEAWLPDLGWVAFDPAHGICADDAYVRVAAGLDYSDAAPIVGSRRGGGTESMAVEVVVSAPALRSQRQSQRQSQSGGGQKQTQSQGRSD
jgi:transglutaminase-like putative cysteine protease